MTRTRHTGITRLQSREKVKARTTRNNTVGDIKVDAVPVSLIVPGRGVVGRVCESGQAI